MVTLKSVNGTLVYHLAAALSNELICRCTAHCVGAKVVINLPFKERKVQKVGEKRIGESSTVEK